jgi:PST family polysaccharide transporter/lipopolysaccharide exporter
LPIIPALQILCFFGATRSIGATMGPVLLALGKPMIQTILSVFQLILMVSIIYPMGQKWGLTGVAYAVLIPNIFALVSISLVTMKLLTISFTIILKQIYIPIIVTFTSCLATILINNYVGAVGYHFGIMGLGLIYLLFYLSLLLLINKLFNLQLEETILNRIYSSI